MPLPRMTASTSRLYKSVGQSRGSVVGLGLDLPQSLLQMRQKGISGVGIRLSQIAVGIAEGITDLLSGVVFPDPHYHGLDAAGAGHTGRESPARRWWPRWRRSCPPTVPAPPGPEQASRACCASRGSWVTAKRTFSPASTDSRRRRQLLGQHAGGQQPGRQKAAGDQQQEEGEYTEPIRPGAAAGRNRSRRRSEEE